MSEYLEKEGRGRVSLPEIFLTFTKIGITGFGGGMAVVALVERVCVKEKRWISAEEFMHGLAFGQLLGPFSLNVCTFTGNYLRGVWGGIIAAFGFVFPSFLMVSFLSWLYFAYNRLPQLQAALRGTNPVIIGLIAVVAIDMGSRQIRSVNAALLAAVSFFASTVLRLNAAIILLAAVLWALSSAICRRRNC